MSAVNDMLDDVFGARPQIVVPWPTPSRQKTQPLFVRDTVARFVAEQPRLVYVDPHELFATQMWVLRGHVRHYLSGEWERTGRTSADMHQRANRYPLIYPDHRGRMIILAGHHRSMAARIEGRPLLARVVGSQPEGGVAVTPSLAFGGPSVSGEAVATVGEARDRLARAGLSVDEVDERIRFARLDEVDGESTPSTDDDQIPDHDVTCLGFGDYPDP